MKVLPVFKCRFLFQVVIFPVENRFSRLFDQRAQSYFLNNEWLVRHVVKFWTYENCVSFGSAISTLKPIPFLVYVGNSAIKTKIKLIVLFVLSESFVKIIIVQNQQKAIFFSNNLIVNLSVCCQQELIKQVGAVSISVYLSFLQNQTIQNRTRLLVGESYTAMFQKHYRR